MTVTFLGTGTSHGVPMIGCRCRVCRSHDPRDRRWRPSILLRFASGAQVLVDTSTDLRAQALAFGVDRVDAVVYTHSHADHILGFDETRRYNAIAGASLPVYADRPTLDDLRRCFMYAFEHPSEKGGGLPHPEPRVIEGPFTVVGRRFVPVPIWHGRRPILGLRVGAFAYLTDCSGIPDDSLPLLDGLEVLVLGALRHRPHPTHFTLAEAVDTARRVGARHTLFTHMCHDLGHAETTASLPDGIALAFDGLQVEVEEEGQG